MLKLHRFLPVVVIPLFAVGCAGPERKLGRGLRNITEFAHGGEMSRSVEQTTLWEGTQRGVTTGVIRGFNRSVARTLIGVAEVATFYAPWPKNGEWTYDACYTPDGPMYPDYSMATYTDPWGGLRLPEDPGTPDSFRYTYPAITTFDTDGELGITGGSILPGFPFGKFIINEQ
ncbi:MAG: exosortase system-associated protein, TIGR04073 family [Verrucomicrobiales bacterium]|nr:exosortase system-associated protein, TIGR04073 family [Verrucomicrobiales bacterium]